jgi:hypothetical protein
MSVTNRERSARDNREQSASVRDIGELPTAPPMAMTAEELAEWQTLIERIGRGEATFDDLAAWENEHV